MGAEKHLIFSKDLATKNVWRMIQGTGLWALKHQGKLIPPRLHYRVDTETI
jgi:hypothetical protein